MAGVDLFCTRCHEAGKPKSVTKGSFLIELVLWICFIVPGVCYSLWRLTTRHKACRSCGGDALVPMHSNAARAANWGRP